MAMTPSDMAPMIAYLLSYLIGSIPFGLLIAQAMGAGDIRQRGSGNIGATNVLRTAGRRAGGIVLALDMLKGALPVLAVQIGFASHPELSWILMGVVCAAFLGHLYPIYLKFIGGKGVATGLGIFLALTPAAGMVALIVWLIMAGRYRISSLAALTAFASLPIGLMIFRVNIHFLPVSIFVTAMVFWRHRDNIRRLYHGTEPRIGVTKTDQTDAA